MKVELSAVGLVLLLMLVFLDVQIEMDEMKVPVRHSWSPPSAISQRGTKAASPIKPEKNF